MNLKAFFKKYIYDKNHGKHECIECPGRFFDTKRGLSIHNGRSRKNGKHRFVTIEGYFLSKEERETGHSS